MTYETIQSSRTTMATSVQVDQPLALTDNTEERFTELPPPDALAQLLKQISIEAAAGPNSVIKSPEEKLEIQSIIKQHVLEKGNQREEAKSEEQKGDASLSVNGPSSSYSLAPPSSGLALPPLFRDLSDAAATGLISHELKTNIKRRLLREYSLTPQIQRPTHQLIRQISEKGEVTLTTEKIDTSYINQDECEEMQQEECEAIEAIYGEDFLRGGGSQSASASASVSSSSSAAAVPSISSGSSSLTLRVRPSPSQPELGSVHVELEFQLPSLYPYVRPSFKLLRLGGKLVEADGMMVTTAINEELNQIYHIEPLPSGHASVCLFQLILAAQTFLQEYEEYLNDKEYHAQVEKEKLEQKKRLQQVESHAQAVLQHLNHKHHHHTAHSGHDFSKASDPAALAAYRAEYEARLKEEARLEEIAREEWKQAHILLDQTFIQEVLPSPKAIHDHITSTCRFSQSASKVSPTYWLQPILSPFLIYRFMKLRAKFNADATSKDRGAISIAFHGCRGSDATASITANGLVVPGEVIEEREPGDTRPQTDGTVLQHSTDNGWFGRGIYVSPSLQYASGYGHFGSLFVCLVLRGESFCCPYSPGRGLEPGYDSHNDPAEMEWILFERSAVLPIYIIQADGSQTNNEPYPVEIFPTKW